jgi:hypothetical protein
VYGHMPQSCVSAHTSQAVIDKMSAMHVITSTLSKSRSDSGPCHASPYLFWKRYLPTPHVSPSSSPKNSAQAM